MASRGGKAAIALAVCLTGLTLPGSAGAVTTLGSPMTVTANAGVPGCGTAPCTHSQSELPGRVVSSPVNGTVVRWRFDYSASVGSVRLKVVRPLATGGLFTSGLEHSYVGTPPIEVASSLPISIGDRIAIEQVSGAGNPQGLSGVTGAKLESWDPPLPDGVATPPTFNDVNFELYLSADIEPTNAFTVGKLTKKPKKGTASLSLNLPNPGELTVTGPGTGKALTKPSALAVTAPGAATLQLRPTKATRARLRRKGKAGGSVLLTYTPRFGTATTQTVRVGLKLKP